MNEAKNTTGNVYCKADINRKNTKYFIILRILSVISGILFAILLIPVRTECDRFSDEWRTFNFLGDSVWERDIGLYEEWNLHVWGPTGPLLLISLCIFGLSIIFIIIYLLIRNSAKKCTLELNQDGVFGKKKTLFSTRSISQPFEKIDSVFLKNSLMDKIIGGQTIAINSASSCVKFRCVENAEEFVDKTLEELKKYKESVSSNKSNIPASSGSDTMDALLKLKNLFDQGLITQEEFEEKRKAMINKI